MTEATLPMAVAGLGDRSRLFSRVASVAVPVLALSVLLGWRLEHPGLRSVVAGLITTNSVTAIGFILASVALWLLLEAAERLRELRPTLPVLLMSGYSERRSPDWEVPSRSGRSRSRATCGRSRRR